MANDTDLISLEKKLIERQERIEAERESLDRAKKALDKQRDELIEKLEKVTHLTAEEAKDELLKQIEAREAEALAKIIRQREEEAKSTADKRAKEIVVESMRHGAVSYIPEYTVSIVRIPDEEVKGRIIGKEGRNIRAFEQATGVDVDLDEEGIIRLSSFDQVRREIARRSLEKLITDTRVQPFRIEEIVEETRKEVERIMFQEGEKLAQEVGVYNLPADIIAILGRAKFRTSYGQNLTLHLLETAKIGTHIAEEVGADVNVVRIACVLHDIGKVVPGDGSHVKLGVDLLKKYNIPQPIIDCVAQHHEDAPFTSIESVIVHVADAISAARPGARYEDVEEYAVRLSDMEDIAKKYDGVEDAYAFEAGRELRVIINPGKLDDAETTVLAEKIREEVSNSLAIPGEVKVTAIREFRAVSGNE